MTYTTLINTQELFEHLSNPDWLVVDCRYQLSDPDLKEEEYLEAHIPGSIYAHLDRDLSGEVVPGSTGRHPLPSQVEAGARFSQMGIGSGVQVVAYDDQGGSLAAGRLWIMLRWLGHENVAVLDGGWQKWLKEERPIEKGRETRPAKEFTPQINADLFVDLAEVDRIRLNPNYRLIDVRLPERYSGEVEPIDPIPGHIPGSINFPYMENLAESGVFRSPAELRDCYENLLQGIPPKNVVFYCGSGVTSIQSLLALKVSGLGLAKLYPGSWSEWIADPTRPIALGNKPG
jgi:thiosulfate/3-mercaptopyruvate sulfurtransferase